MPATPEKDHATAAFTRRIIRDDPAVTAEWAATIKTEPLRTLSLEEVGRGWLRADLERAEQWFIDAGLPELIIPIQDRD